MTYQLRKQIQMSNIYSKTKYQPANRARPKFGEDYNEAERISETYLCRKSRGNDKQP